MKKQISACAETFPLNAAGIDRFSGILEEQLPLRGDDRENRIRIRLSLEESLLRMRDHFGENGAFGLTVDRRLGRIQIRIEHEGDIFNPLSKTQAELEDWSGSLLTAVGISPLYSYAGGKNILRLNLTVGGVNSAVKILIAVAVGLAVGFLLREVLPETAANILTVRFLTPVYSLWLRILTVLSGPMIFLMVLTSVLNTGTIQEEGGNSRRIVLRYFLISLIAALIAVAVSAAISHQQIVVGRTLGIDAAGYFEAVLQIVPGDVVSPLAQGNTPQILLIAFVAGNAIVLFGARASGLSSVIRQANMAGLLLMEGVSRLVPFFAAALLCMEIVGNTMNTFAGMWGILVMALIISAAFLIIAVTAVSVRKKVPVRLLWKKVLPAFLTAVRTGGLDEGFGRMEQTTIRGLGVERHFATVSLPYGLILCMPVNVIGTLMFTMYSAAKYSLAISPGWLIVAVVLSVVLFVATPPVPGANLLAYIIIFGQLGIPGKALIDAMIFDILFGIFASAANQTVLQMDLIIQADKIGLLDLKKLRKE